MYLRTPKRYTARGRRARVFNLRWLWLYLIAPPIIVLSALAWDYRATLSGLIGNWTARNVKIELSRPTPTPTIPASDLTRTYTEAIRAGRMDSAISALSALGDVSPNDPALFSTLTRFMLFRGDPDDEDRIRKAYEMAQMAINANPESAEGWIMTALTLDKLGEPAAALPYALRARDLDEDNPLLLAVTAEVYYDLGQYEEASDLVDQAIEKAKAASPIVPFHLMYAHWVNGLILLDQSGAAAQAQFEEAYRAARIEQTLPIAYIAQNLWRSYVAAGRTDDAVQMLEEAGTRDKDDPLIPYLLGRVYAAEVNWDQARPFFAQCLDLDPVHLRCLRWFGQVSFQQGNFKAAADNAQKAVDNGTQESEAFLIAGLAYIQQVPPLCAQAVPLLQQGFNLNEASQATSERKAELRVQFEGGLRSCNANPVRSAPQPTATPG